MVDEGEQKSEQAEIGIRERICEWKNGQRRVRGKRRVEKSGEKGREQDVRTRRRYVEKKMKEEEREKRKGDGRDP